MSDAAKKLEVLRQRRLALEAEEKAVVASRIAEIAALVDRCGASVLTDEIIVGVMRGALESTADVLEVYADKGAKFLRTGKRRSESKPRAVRRSKGTASSQSTDLAGAPQNAPTPKSSDSGIGENG